MRLTLKLTLVVSLCLLASSVVADRPYTSQDGTSYALAVNLATTYLRVAPSGRCDAS